MFKFVVLTLCIFSMGCSSTSDNLQSLKEGDSVERADAIYWFYENGNEDTTKKLLKRSLEKDPSPVIRALAIRLMVLSDDKTYLPLIVKALKDEDYSVRMEAAQAVGSFYALDLQNNLVTLVQKDPHVWVKLKALKSIGYMEAKETVPGLMKTLKNQEHSVQLQIVTLLEKFTGQKFGFDLKAWDSWYKTQYSTET